MDNEQLAYLLDPNSNSNGAMLLHLAAAERFYEIHTFEINRLSRITADLIIF
jgi:hypothetical protein